MLDRDERMAGVDGLCAWLDDSRNADAHTAQLSNYLQRMELALQLPDLPDPKTLTAVVDDYCQAHPHDEVRSAIEAAFATIDSPPPDL